MVFRNIYSYTKVFRKAINLQKILYFQVDNLEMKLQYPVKYPKF